MPRKVFLTLLLSLIVMLFNFGTLSINLSAYAQNQDCKCTYEVDSVNGDQYYVLKKELELSCIVLVLSKSCDDSDRVAKLKSAGYSIIGRFKTFEGARFMAIGECSSCK